MRAEDAAVGVRLVDDDPAQVRDEVTPALVVGQEPHVHHVRVGEDQVRAAPETRAVLARRVAVVDRVAQVGKLEGRELPRLVLGERLGGVEVERTRLGVEREALQDGQIERERLAGCCAAGRDHVALAALAQRLVLVRVEALDPGAAQAVGEDGRQVRGERDVDRALALLERGGDQAPVVGAIRDHVPPRLVEALPHLEVIHARSPPPPASRRAPRDRGAAGSRRPAPSRA